MSVTKKQYDKQFKFKTIIRLIKSEETTQQICSQTGIHASVIQRWKKQFTDNGPDIFEEAKTKAKQDKASETNSHMERKIGQLTLEGRFLKKSLGALDIEARKTLVDSKDPLSISCQCDLLGVNRGCVE